jgi:hypothetical protein
MKRDPVIQWSPVSQTAILRGIQANAWWAGHVNAILVLPPGSEYPGALLVGADTGGIWLIQQPSNNSPNAPARCLTDDWDDPNIQCIAGGPNGPNHVFAGMTTGLKETDTTQGFPLEGVCRDISPPNVGQVVAIAVLSGIQKVVLAATTGIYWASITPAGGAYNLVNLTTVSRSLQCAHGMAPLRHRVAPPPKRSPVHLEVSLIDTRPGGDFARRFKRDNLPLYVGMSPLLRDLLDIAEMAYMTDELDKR